MFYYRLGIEYVRAGENQKAIESLTYSVQVLDSRLGYFARNRAYVSVSILHDAVHTVCLSLTQLGSAYERVGNVDEAIRAFQRGIDLIKQFQARTPAEESLYRGLGRLYLSQKDFPLALENFQRALALAEKQQQVRSVSGASISIGNALRQSGKPAEAIPYYQTAIQNTESTRSLLQSQENRQSFFEGGLGAYVSMIGVLSASGKVDEAFSFNERARSRAFLDILGSKAQLSRTQSGLQDEEMALQQRILTLKTNQGGGGEGGPVSDQSNLRRALGEAERAYNDFLAKVRKENKEQASLINVEPLTASQFQQLLDPGVTVLEYFVTPNQVLIWVVDKERVISVGRFINRTTLLAKVNMFRESISQLEDLPKLKQQSVDLYTTLIEPALPHIRGKELIIIPHDVLHYLPFQALLSPSGKYLIEDYPINYLSSASLMQFTQEKRKAKGELTKILAEGGKILTFGNPDLDDPAMALKFAGIEAKEIKSLYPQSTIYLEKEATEEKAKALVGTSDIIHFASHAELNEDDPLASAIRLAKSDKEDGRLEVREIFGMDLKASLVVLSACETGLGKLSSGDELVGLTRAFIYAGTPSVVASLWNVEDSSTAQLMASFYKNLKTMTKVEALRQAQLNLIRGNVNSDLLARRGIGGVGKLGEVPAAKPSDQSLSQDPVSISTSHPFFWAPFILVGEGK
jgi:CHAT domain-containing protein